MPHDNDDYEVVYARPPRHSRFVKGQSGNPKSLSLGSSSGESCEPRTVLEAARRASAAKRRPGGRCDQPVISLRSRTMLAEAATLGLVRKDSP